MKKMNKNKQIKELYTRFNKAKIKQEIHEKTGIPLATIPSMLSRGRIPEEHQDTIIDILEKYHEPH